MESGKRRIRKKRLITHRELDVLKLHAAGLSFKEIAEDLGIRPYTVIGHIRNMEHKVGLPNRVALAVWAVGNAVVENVFISPLTKA